MEEQLDAWMVAEVEENFLEWLKSYLTDGDWVYLTEEFEHSFDFFESEMNELFSIFTSFE